MMKEEKKVVLDKDFLLNELKERIKFLRTEEKEGKKLFPAFYRERRLELERLVQQIESGIFDHTDKNE